MLHLINPVRRAEPFDHPDWLFEVKFDGFRAAADTVRGRLQRFIEETGADELMVSGGIFDHAARLYSYQLLAEKVAPSLSKALSDVLLT